MEVNADDTDVAVMLVHHWNEEKYDILFHSWRSNKSWSIKESSSSLSPDMKSNLLFVHPFSGCDTTSAVFGIGKTTAFKKFKGMLIIST